MRFRQLIQWLIILILLPGLILAGAEGALRLSGYGWTTAPFLTRYDGDTTFHAVNPLFYQQFFGLSVYKLAYWHEYAFQVREEKDDNTIRIFIFGGSAAHGAPPDPAYGFWRILEVMLQNRFPETRFEVIDTAFPGINSHGMRLMAEACANHAPDIFLVYLGNNEMNGPFGAVTPEARGRLWNPTAIRMGIRLRNLRLIQAATGKPESGQQKETGRWEHHIALPDPRIEGVYSHFRENLDAICRAGITADAAVVLCTVGSNLRDWAPSSAMHQRNLPETALLSWTKAFEKGKAVQAGRMYAEALARYEAAAEIDDTYAELAWRMMQCAMKLGDMEKAREYAVRARDMDTFRTRTDSTLNRIIRETGENLADAGVSLADVEKHLRETAPDGLPGYECFWDNVHFTFSGNYRTALFLLPYLEKELAGNGLTPSGNENPLTEQECAERLGLTPPVRRRHIDTVIRKNTQGYGRSVTHLEKMKADLLQQENGTPEAIEIAGYRNALAQQHRDFLIQRRLAHALLDTGDLEDALAAARELEKAYPLRNGSLATLLLTLGRTGQYDKALEVLDRLLAFYPDDADSCLNLAIIIQDADPEKALALFRQAAAIRPALPETCIHTARFFVKQQQPEKAHTAFLNAIRINPDYSRSCREYDEWLTSAFSTEERETCWRELCKEYPQQAFPRLYHAMALESGGDLPGALIEYHTAAEYAPGNPEVQQAVNDALSRLETMK